MEKITIRDVARMAGVSVSTASRSLSGSSLISAETKQRVRDAAKKLNYTPNTAARNLRRERSRSIGVVFPHMSAEFYARCASAILRAAAANDYTVLFAESGPDQASARKNINALIGNCVEGVLFIGDNDDNDLISDLRSRSIPVVTGDRTVDDIPSVTFNNRETMRALVERCIKIGYKRLVYVGGTPKFMQNLSQRLKGFNDAINAHPDVWAKCFLNDSICCQVNTGFYDLFAREIAQLKPDIVITPTDNIAQCILRTAHDLHIAVPDEMAVTGFDDMRGAANMIPSLTTIHQDVDAFTKKCFDTLQELIIIGTAASSVVEQQIIVRESAPIERNDKL